MSSCTTEIPSCGNVVLPINLNGPRSHWLGQHQTPKKDKDLRHLPGQSYTLAWKCCPNLLSKFTGQETLGLPFILCFHQHIFFKLIVSFLNLFHLFFGSTSGMGDHSSQGIKPTSPALETRSLHHWAVREVPLTVIFQAQKGRDGIFVEKAWRLPCLHVPKPLFHKLNSVFNHS